MEDVASAGAWTTVVPALSEETLATLADGGFVQMTPVQAAVLPRFLRHKDVAVEAYAFQSEAVCVCLCVLVCACACACVRVFDDGHQGLSHTSEQSGIYH